MKRKFLFRLIPLLLALLLEMLPWGAVLYFALDAGKVIGSTFSYFSLIPFGYANLAPLITAYLTALLLLVLLATLKKTSKKVHTALLLLSALTLFVSLCPLFSGIRYYTVVGGGISLCLLVETVFLYWERWDKRENS